MLTDIAPMLGAVWLCGEPFNDWRIIRWSKRDVGISKLNDWQAVIRCDKTWEKYSSWQEPQKHCLWGATTEIDIQDIVVKAVVVALEAWDNKGTGAKEEVKGDF